MSEINNTTTYIMAISSTNPTTMLPILWYNSLADTGFIFEAIRNTIPNATKATSGNIKQFSTVSTLHSICRQVAINLMQGKTNNRWHTVGVCDRYGALIGVGKERKKTDAEQLASKDALVHLGVISADHGVDFFKRSTL